jgi:hypothetical protein
VGDQRLRALLVPEIGAACHNLANGAQKRIERGLEAVCLGFGVKFFNVFSGGEFESRRGLEKSMLDTFKSGTYVMEDFRKDRKRPRGTQ